MARFNGRTGQCGWRARHMLRREYRRTHMQTPIACAWHGVWESACWHSHYSVCVADTHRHRAGRYRSGRATGPYAPAVQHRAYLLHVVIPQTGRSRAAAAVAQRPPNRHPPGWRRCTGLLHHCGRRWRTSVRQVSSQTPFRNEDSDRLIQISCTASGPHRSRDVFIPAVNRSRVFA